MILSVIGGTYFAIRQVSTLRAVTYLCDKYSFKLSDIDLLDYEQGHEVFYTRDSGSFVPDFKHGFSNSKWKFEVNSRIFFVNYESHKFYDDYQLEEIEKWSTECLQKNIDPKIVGIEYSTHNIIEYQKSLGRDGNKYIFTEEHISDFINNFNSYKNNYTFIFFYTPSPNEKEYEKYSDNIKGYIDKNIQGRPYIIVYHLTNPEIKMHFEKDYVQYGFEQRYEWCREYYSPQYW